MIHNNTIGVAVLVGTTIHTRESSDILMQEIKRIANNEIELDFSNVDYISRSFADQLFYDKTKMAEKLKKAVVISNANEEVIHMLQTVERTQNKTNRNMSSIPVYKFSSQEQFEHFLLNL